MKYTYFGPISRHHEMDPNRVIWTPEIPPVSSYSRLYIHYWTYSGHLWTCPGDPLGVHTGHYVHIGLQKGIQYGLIS